MRESLLHDFRFAVRLLYRNGTSTAVIVVALAIGIAVNTVVFTAYKTLVVRQLDARAPDEMVNVALVRDSGATDSVFSYPDYEAYRDAVQSLSGLVAFRLDQLTLSTGGASTLPRSSGNAELATVHLISENYFKVLGVSPIEGRTFDSMSVRDSSADPPVLISENYWRRRFDADPAILGKIVRLNGVSVTVIGIAPRDFIGTGVTSPAFWAPITIEPLIQGDADWLRRREDQRYRLYGRLAPGTGVSQAQAEMTALANRIRTLHDPRSDSAKPATMLVWPGSTVSSPVEPVWPRTKTNGAADHARCGNGPGGCVRQCGQPAACSLSFPSKRIAHTPVARSKPGPDYSPIIDGESPYRAGCRRPRTSLHVDIFESRRDVDRQRAASRIRHVRPER